MGAKLVGLLIVLVLYMLFSMMAGPPPRAVVRRGHR